MKVFISWSGPRSRHLADSLRAWLPRVIQSLRPWMSDEDIGAGSRWLPEISKELSGANVGIFCVTPENQLSPWLVFEAGALSKMLDETFVCPLLYGMSAAQLTGPLAQFQALPFDKEGVFRMLANLNQALGSNRLNDQDLLEIFEVWWPKLELKLAQTPPTHGERIQKRTNEELLEEIVTNSRETLRRENVRLEYWKAHDEKMDKVVPMMQQFISGLAKMCAGDKQTEHIFEPLQPSLEVMKEMSDESRELTQKLLTPTSEEASGSDRENK